jgi:hypothetical protein
VQAAQHECYLDTPVRDSKGSVTGKNRDHLEVAARKGSARAIAALYNGPQIPDSVAYLWDWARELHGKSGVGMSGFNPLTYTTIADWARLTGNEPEPHEVEALFWLDAILLNPPKDLA